MSGPCSTRSAQTNHKRAPWTLIPAESKAYARVAVIEAVVEQLERGMRAAGQDPLDAEADVVMA